MKTSELYQTVTDKVIAQMEAAQGDWTKPWVGCTHIPTSQATGKPYQGLNVFWLMMAGYTDHRWGAYGTWKKAGAQVRKGEKSTVIAQPVVVRGKDEDDDGFLTFKALPVFNAEQVDGVEDLPSAGDFTETERVELAEAFIAGTGARITFGSGEASYNPVRDCISLPDPDAFHTTQGYYSTALHELGHWTGHKTRCDREQSGFMQTEAYAFEELVAELSSAYLCALLGIEQTPREDHAEYLAHWIKRLKDDPKAFPNAATLAQTACDYLQKIQPAAAAA